MKREFQSCGECGYDVESTLRWCPNCGLYTADEEQSVFERLMKREVERKRHPESLIRLELELEAEIQRLEESLAQLEKTRAPLLRRVEDARRAGRAGGALEEAAAQIELACQDARLLIQRHRALLEGVGLERKQNALRVAMSELGTRELPELAQAPDPEAHIALPIGLEPIQLEFAQDGTVWALSKSRLFRWHPGEERMAEEWPVPHGQALCMALSPGGVVLVGGRGGLHIALPDRGFVHSVGVSRGQWGVRPALSSVAWSPDEDWILAGTDEGPMYRFSIPASLADFAPAEVERVTDAHAFGVAGVAIPASGRALTAGTGRIKSWWVTNRGMTKFSEVQAPDVGRLIRAGTHVLAIRDSKIAVWEDNLSGVIGELAVMGSVKGAAPAPDNVRVLMWEDSGLWLGSPTTKTVFPLLRPAGRLRCAALSGQRLVVATENPVTGSRLEVYDLEQTGLVGWTLAAFGRLATNVEIGQRLLPKEAHRRAAADSALLDQVRGLLAEATGFALQALNRRVQVVEDATNQVPVPPSVVDHLAALFEELGDFAAALVPVADIAPGVRPQIARVHRLPTALLLRQVDALLHRIETLYGGLGMDMDHLDAALVELESMEAWLDQLERLGNGLTGPFWGTPDRARLIEAIHTLKKDFPAFIDGIHARIAAAALGKLDSLQEHSQLEILRDQRRRIERIAGPDKDEADLVLQDTVEGGPLGQEAGQEKRQKRIEGLGRARRELGAETEAYLETHDL
ncbi:MAG: hypothetical protein GY913_02220 [Proteobacteria bacterium]|nr:hypothetical protein [Pseudomonadota bacterium]MCP4915715.1 hypothetical protein [Pseudomonadota bacterium]